MQASSIGKHHRVSSLCRQSLNASASRRRACTEIAPCFLLPAERMTRMQLAAQVSSVMAQQIRNPLGMLGCRTKASTNGEPPPTVPACPCYTSLLYSTGITACLPEAQAPAVSCSCCRHACCREMEVRGAAIARQGAIIASKVGSMLCTVSWSWLLSEPWLCGVPCRHARSSMLSACRAVWVLCCAGVVWRPCGADGLGREH